MEKAELSSDSSPLPVTIRVACNQDAKPIKELVFSVMTEFGLTPEPQGLDADLEDIEGTYLRCGGLFEVVQTADGTIVGTAGILIRPGGVAELRKMYVRKDFRGRGLGKTLLEHMLAHARKQGVHEVELETNSCLKEAIRLYVKYGFRPIDRKPFSRRCDQVYRLTLT